MIIDKIIKELEDKQFDPTLSNGVNFALGVISRLNVSTPESFEKFWLAYPKKVAKKEAVKAWDKLKVDEQLFIIIMDKIEKMKGTRAWSDSAYIPYPATWLNGERWNDEVAAPVTKTGDKYDGI